MKVKLWSFGNYKQYTNSQIGSSVLTRLHPIYMDRSKQSVIECMKDWPAGCKVLDAGAGDGYTMDIIRDNGFDVYGIDLDPDRTKTAIRFGHKNVITGDLTKLPWSDETFDIVYNRHTLEHVITPEEVLREFSRVLKPTGHLSLIVPIVDKSDFRKRHPHLVPSWQYVNWLVERNGFKIIRIETRKTKWNQYEVWALACKE